MALNSLRKRYFRVLLYLARTTPRIVFVLLGIVQIASVAGAVFGWPSLETIYVVKGIFNQSCNSTNTDDADGTCRDQELRLSQIFVAGSWASQGGRFINGILIDRYGHQLGSLFGGAMIVMGALFMGFSTNDLPLYIPGMFLLGWGGPMFQLIAQRATGLYPKYRSIIMTVFSGLFNTSSYVFLIFNLIFTFLGTSDQTLFLTYAIFLAVLTIVTFFFTTPLGQSLAMLENQLEKRSDIVSLSENAEHRTAAETRPTTAGQQEGRAGAITGRAKVERSKPEEIEMTVTQDAHENGAESPVRQSFTDTNDDTISSEAVTDKKDGIFDGLPSFRRQVLSLDYISAHIFFMVHNLTVQFEVAAVGGQVRQMVAEERAANMTLPLSSEQLVLAFNAALGGVVIVNPLLGLLIAKIGFGAFFYITNILFLGFNISTIFLPSYLQPISYVLYSVGRTGLYGNYFSYCAARFGFTHFGKLTGITGLLTAVFTLLQYPLLGMALDLFDGNYDVAYYILASLSLPLTLCCEYMRRRDVFLKPNNGTRLTEEEFPPPKEERSKH